MLNESGRLVDHRTRPRTTAGHPPGYRLLRESASSLVVPRSIIRVEGTDAFDFLHRMSTNDLRTLGDGEARRSVFTNEKGRVIDLVTVGRAGDAAVIIGSPGSADELARWLGKFIIMDDVRLSALSGQARLPSIYGPDTRAIIQKIPTAGIVREDLGSVPGFLFVPAADGADRSSTTAPPWQGQDIPIADPLAFETVRIEESVPLLGRELGPDVNALEAGLKEYISFSKGCYIGQEVIARLDTYRKLQNILTLFILPDYDGAMVSPGKVFQGGREAGRITSTTFSPLHEAWIGLGYRRLRVTDTGFDFLQEGEECTIPCKVLSGLPHGYAEYEVQE